MRRFRFGLEKLLWQRRRVEDAAWRELAEAMRGEHLQAEALAQATVAAREAAGSFCSALRESVAGTELLRHAAYRQALRQGVLRQRALHVDAAAAVVERRGSLLARRREREAVETVRRQSWERFLQEVDREAQAVTDEAAVIGHVRKRRESEE